MKDFSEIAAREKIAWDLFLKNNPIIKEKIKRFEMMGSEKREKKALQEREF